MALWRSGAGGAQVSTGPGALSAGVGPRRGSRGPLRREKLNGCFFLGRRQEGTSGRCSRRFKVHCPILWARCHTTVRRPSSSGLVERGLRIHPACFGAMAQSDVDVFPASYLGIVCRSSSSGQLRGGSGTLGSSIPSASTTMCFFLGGAGLVRETQDPEVDPSDAVSNRLGAWFSKLLGRPVRAGWCVLEARSWGGRYEPVDRLIDVDELLDCDEEVQSVDRMHAKWRVSNSADEKKRFVLLPFPPDSL